MDNNRTHACLDSGTNSVYRPIHSGIVFMITTLVLFCSCTEEFDELFREPDITPVKEVLTAAMPLGYAANLTFAAISGETLPNVTIATTGTDSTLGCFLCYIEVDDAFPLPGNMLAHGRIITAGMSVDDDFMMMTALFTEMDIEQGTFTIRDISTIPVVVDSSIITGKKMLYVAYAEIDINSGSDTLLSVGISEGQITAEFTKYETMKDFDSTIRLEENAWIIMVDDNTTSTDPSDDTYTICGGGQYIEAGNDKAGLFQLVMINAQMSPACTLNPSAGWALFQNVGVGQKTSDTELGHVLLQFHSSCDGNAKIAASTGTYVRAFGDEVTLELGE